ncbi:hypothetical protein JYG32_06480 [Burkholderia pyrrocinia]|nr:hypothetical protein JYG32_06480 [Burkholderia pyrrocinia]
MPKKSPYREDTGVPDTFAVATLCSWQRCDSSHTAQFPEAGIFFDEILKFAGLRMTRHVGRLRADARARIAGDVAAQVAARHGLPAGLRGGRRLAEGIAVILLVTGRFRAIVGVSWSGQRQGNDNAACNEQ